MAKINSLDDIAKIKVHWTESDYINESLGVDDDGDIEKIVDASLLNGLIRDACTLVPIGYDKIVLSVKLKDGLQWCDQCKFYLNSNKKDLLTLLNSG
jgi:hypothetical protein